MTADGQPRETKVALPEPPLDLIRELAQRMPVVFVSCRRRNMRGGFSTAGSLTVETKDLGDGGLELKLGDLYGGGEYHVLTLHPDNHMEELLPKYSTSVDGSPKQLNEVGDRRPLDPREHRQLRLMQPMPQHPAPPPGYVSLPPITQPQQQNPRDLYGRLPDEYLDEQVKELRAEMAGLKEQNDRARADAERRIEQLRVDNERLRIEAREERAKHDKELLLARLEQLEHKKTGPDLGAVSTMVAAMVPVFVEMVRSSATRAEVQAKQQQEAVATQLRGIETLVTATTSKKPDLDIVKLLEVGMPLMKLFMDGRDPGKMADIITAMGENQMGLLSLCANALSQMGGDDASPGMRLIQEALQGAVHIAERMAASREQSVVRQLPQQPQYEDAPPRRRVVEAPPQATTQAPPAAPVAATAPAPAEVVDPAIVAGQILASPGWPSAMKSAAWRKIMRDLHDPSVDARAAAEAFGAGLDQLYDAGKLPAALRPIFADDSLDLHEAFAEVLAGLPVASDQARVVVIVETLAAQFRRTDDDADAPEGAAGDDDDDADDDLQVVPATNGAKTLAPS